MNHSKSDHGDSSGRPQFLEGVVQALRNTSAGDMKATAEQWRESLREKLEADPVGTLLKGVSIGAGLVALNRSHVRQGASYLVKLLAFKALSQFQSNSTQSKETN